MSDILLFIWAVLGHWQAWLTGGLVIAVFTVVERYREKAFSWKVFAWFPAAFLLVAFYLTWHDEHVALTKAVSEKATLETRLSEKDRSMAAAKRLETTSILNFGSVLDGNCSERRFTLKGAVAGDSIRQGWPPNLPYTVTANMLVAQNDTISARICNVGTGKTVTYNSVTVRAMIER